MIIAARGTDLFSHVIVSFNTLFVGRRRRWFLGRITCLVESIGERHRSLNVIVAPNHCCIPQMGTIGAAFLRHISWTVGRFRAAYFVEMVGSISKLFRTLLIVKRLALTTKPFPRRIFQRSFQRSSDIVTTFILGTNHFFPNFSTLAITLSGRLSHGAGVFTRATCAI